MKLYEWKLRARGAFYTYLVMAASLDAARQALVANIRQSNDIVVQEEHHDELILTTEPLFIADENYPVVIW